MRHFVDDDFDPMEDYEGHCCGPNWKSDDDDYESTIKHFQD